MDDEALVQSELLRCNRCGYCLSTCPTYAVTHSEADVARGRNALLEALRGGELESLPELRGPFFDCLLCGACQEACPSSVATDEIMVRARQRYHAERGQPFVQRFIFRRLLGYPARLAALLRLLGTGQRTGLTRLARRLRLLRWVSPALETAEDLAGEVPRRFLREALQRVGFHRRAPWSPDWVMRRDPEARQRGPQVAYFLGCGTNFQVPRSGEAAARLLARAGCQVVLRPHLCCGLPPYAYGDLDSARELAARNLDLLGDSSLELVVTDCGSCSGMLKDYGELFAGDPARQAQAVAFSGKVRDLTQLLLQYPLPPPVRPWPGKVTWHDPCHLGRKQGLREAPRRLLVECAGADFVELPEADRCCGGAGSFALTHPELAGAILDRKVDHLLRTGAETVVTACPSCMMQLRYGLRRRGVAMQVRHLAEVLAQAQGIELKT